MTLHRPPWIALLFVACRGAEQPPRSSTPAVQPSTRAVAVTSAARRAPPLPEGASLDPLPEKKPMNGARVALTVPSGSSLSREEALGLPVDVSVTGAPAGSPIRVQLALDDAPSRPVVGGAPTPLRKLLPEDQVLAEGAHRVVAVLTHPDGDPVRNASGVVAAAATLLVGAADGEPRGPEIVVLEPHGTYNGPSAAASAVLSYYVIDAPPDASIRVEVTTTGTRTLRLLSPDRSYAIGHLDSGDYRFALRLSGGPETVRTITVNLDAPVAN